jgi:hypothetical protein
MPEHIISSTSVDPELIVGVGRNYSNDSNDSNSSNSSSSTGSAVQVPTRLDGPSVEVLRPERYGEISQSST